VDPLKRLIFPGLLGLAIYFAVFGGEHSVLDVRNARQSIEAESAELTELQNDIDSLRARADSLESDSATLERIARERYGMIRDGEILYRFVEPEDTSHRIP
jgi:cell division protein FtsB